MRCNGAEPLLSQILRSALQNPPLFKDIYRTRCLARELPQRASVTEKRFVYVIQSESAATQHYVGLTWNVVTRLAAHNAGESPHTRRYRPWRLVVAMAFSTEQKALAFERYLKSGSGAAFLKRHLL